jgi:hypothetical protein
MKFSLYLTILIALAPLYLCAVDLDEQQEFQVPKKISVHRKNFYFLAGTLLAGTVALSILLIPASIIEINAITDEPHPDGYTAHERREFKKFIGLLAISPVIAWYSAKGARYFFKKSLEDKQEENSSPQTSSISAQDDDDL